MATNKSPKTGEINQLTSEHDNVELLDYEDDEMIENNHEMEIDDSGAARSPVKDLAKTVQNEIQEDKRNKRKKASEGKDLNLNNSNKTETQRELGEVSKARQTRSKVKGKLNFEDVRLKTPVRTKNSKIKNQDSKRESEESKKLPNDNLENEPKDKGKGLQDMKTKATPSKAGRPKSSVKSIRKSNDVVISEDDYETDADSSEDSSSESSSSSDSASSSDDEPTYRRSKKKRNNYKRRKTSLARDRERRKEKTRRKKKRRSKSKEKKGSMKVILQELADLKEQLRAGQKGNEAFNINSEKGKSPRAELNENGEIMKSPSDTAVFAPAVMKDSIGSPKTPIVNRIVENQTNKGLDLNEVDTQAMVLDFIRNVRLTGNDKKKETAEVRSVVTLPTTSKETEEERRSREEREKAQEAVIQAEKFNATINPAGKSYYDIIKSLNLRDPDEEFYHIVCHVDKQLREKIKRGEFVELEKLLRKNKFSKPKEKWQMGRNAEGFPIWEPCEDKECKITGIYKWDQAFRAYATIYSQDNPTRASEIWQYIESIHNAAKVYSWENVANYDYCFRQLMHDNPDRSWAKPYLQMWTTTLCEPNNRNHNYNNNNGRSEDKKNGGVKICWRFNKGKCHLTNCRFEHRCSYCGGGNHAAINCYKKANKRKSNKEENGESESPARKVVRK